MENNIPNFGQYGFVQPKNWLNNWQDVLVVLGILGGITYLVLAMFKEKDKNSDDEKKPLLAH